MIVRRVAAVLALDVVDYSKRMTADETATIELLRNLKRDTLLPAFEGWRGRVFKEMGDGMLVEFASVVDAVECAHFVQQCIGDHAGSRSAEALQLRIGIHFGEIVVESEDLLGAIVNIAARIEAICEPGAVWLSEQARQVVGNRLDLSFEALGRHHLKNIAEPIDLYRVGLPSDVPRASNLRSTPATWRGWAARFPSRGVIAAAALCAAIGAAALGAGVFETDGTRVDEHRRLAENLRHSQVFRDCPQCPEMVAVAGGKLLMGAPPKGIEAGAFPSDQGPRRHVEVRAFAIGKFEVTRREFSAFLQDTGYAAPTKCRTWENGASANRSDRSYLDPGYAQGAMHPAVCVSWHDASAYARWLSGVTGHSYRLPSEAEWEFAARGGSDRRFFFGSDLNGICAFDNIGDATARSRWPHWETADCSDGRVFTAPVGSFRGNPFGLFDVYGNVREWVQDCWHSTYHNAPSDSRAWLKGDCRVRTVRGGSWDIKSSLVSSSWRGKLPAGHRDFLYGFRVARDIGR